MTERPRGSGDGLLDHRRHLSLITHRNDAYRLMTGSDQIIAGSEGTSLTSASATQRATPKLASPGHAEAGQ